ncbi:MULTISPECIES: DUF4291 domain-containing protein [Amycolatopsis]|uniref:DUF4291 domain-containing protein n=1 Tax=Amycolatopsis TaxID=1813 RepID=UPI000B8A9940|nr:MULTISPECIES: DUF4291 domain-containing protein [Amycolatopsis]OXM63647.1 hypothetical protein CF166_31235 [Amycolatopsis sp. KNN50.9b]
MSNEIRARYDDDTIVVYQAYSPEIAGPALRAGTFVPPFKRGRMTWIKPSFLWMAHRSGWARKPGQERVLAVTITRAGFEWALAHSCLSAFAPRHHPSEAAWRRQLATSPVRIQWDPDKDLHLRALPERAIQIGLSGDAADRYVDEWITGLTDETDRAHEIEALVRDRRLDEARALLPAERPYPVSAELASRIGAG